LRQSWNADCATTGLAGRHTLGPSCLTPPLDQVHPIESGGARRRSSLLHPQVRRIAGPSSGILMRSPLQQPALIIRF